MTPGEVVYIHPDTDSKVTPEPGTEPDWEAAGWEPSDDATRVPGVTTDTAKRWPELRRP